MAQEGPKLRTNHVERSCRSGLPWHLDSAFLRPGRFDRLIFVPPPDEPARAEIIRIMADGKPVTGLDPASLAKKLKDFSGADIKAVFDQAIEASLNPIDRLV